MFLTQMLDRTFFSGVRIINFVIGQNFVVNALRWKSGRTAIGQSCLGCSAEEQLAMAQEIRTVQPSFQFFQQNICKLSNNEELMEGNSTTFVHWLDRVQTQAALHGCADREVVSPLGQAAKVHVPHVHSLKCTVCRKHWQSLLDKFANWKSGTSHGKKSVPALRGWIPRPSEMQFLNEYTVFMCKITFHNYLTKNRFFCYSQSYF